MFSTLQFQQYCGLLFQVTGSRAEKQDYILTFYKQQYLKAIAFLAEYFIHLMQVLNEHNLLNRTSHQCLSPIVDEGHWTTIISFYIQYKH